MTGQLDYDSDDDPLGYMTTDYPSPYLAESGMDMQRRFFLRGRHARHAWQRVLVRIMIVVPVAFIVLGLMQVAVSLLKKVFG